MKLIPLTQGKYAQVDDEDYEWLNQWKWHFSDGYAVRNAINSFGKRRLVFMHRKINKTPSEFQTDHIDHDKLNNCKSNLRSCTSSENHRNTQKWLHSKMKFKGINLQRGKYWAAHIKINGKGVHIGSFKTPEDAARAYDEAAKKYFGEFAYINYGMEV